MEEFASTPVNGHTDLELIGNNATNLTTTNGNSLPVLSWYGYSICITSMLFIWIVGSIGNFLVIYVVCKDKQLQTPMNMFLVNLSTADFITAAFGSPFPLFASILGYWPFGETICTIYAFGMSLGGITSITTLMVLAFERYLMIARPFRASDVRMQHSTGIILLIWFYSLTITLPPLFGWASYGPEGPYISCSVNWENDDLTTKTYIIFLFVLGLAIPLITVVFSYVGILTTIRSTSQAQPCTRSATARAEVRVIAMVAVMITCFLIAWSPYAIVSLIVAFGGSEGRHLITGLTSILPAIFAKSATCYNPIIYVGLNTQFRASWMKLLGIRRDDNETQTRLTFSAGTSGPGNSIMPTIDKKPSTSSLCPSTNDTQLLKTAASKTLKDPYTDKNSMEKSNQKFLQEEAHALELAPLVSSEKEHILENNDAQLYATVMEGNGSDNSKLPHTNVLEEL